jgi:hypothetical protein
MSNFQPQILIQCAAALVTTKDTLTFRLHPKQLVAFRSKATEILYRGAAGGGKPRLMPPSSRWLLSINVARHVLSWSGWRHFEGRPTPRRPKARRLKAGPIARPLRRQTRLRPRSTP